MNLFIDTSTINGSHSGTGTYSLGLLKTLLNNPSIDNIVAAGGKTEDFIGTDHSKLKSVFYGETNWHKLINFDLFANAPLINSDVAVFPNYFIPYLFPIPSIATIHDISFLTHPKFYSLKTKLFYQKRILHTIKNSVKILTVSEHSKFEIIKHYQIPENKIAVISPGIVFNNFSVGNLKSENRKYFLYLGNIEPKKNILNMIRGFQLSGLDDYELLIVGKPHSNSGYFKKFISETSNCTNVKYLGYSHETDVHRLLNNCSGLVNLSHIEGFGIPVLEAIHFDKPVLVSQTPALTELLTAGSGISVDGNSIREISEGFIELSKLKSAGINQDLINQKYSWNSFNEKLMSVFEEVHSSATTKIAVPDYSIDAISNAIFKTGIYSAIFNCPISRNDLYRSLYKMECNRESFDSTLSAILEEYPDLVFEEKNLLFFYPVKQNYESRLKQIEENKTYIHQNKKRVDFISAIPFVKYMFFSGGTVHANHADEKDVDLFIITKKNRVWISYTVFRVLSKFNKNFNPLCFNYVVDEMAAAIGYQHDFYTAHQLIYLLPVNEKSEKFNIMGFNNWIYNFFPNMKYFVTENIPSADLKKNDLMGLLNLMLLSLWTWNFKRKKIANGTGGILIDAHRIKLHTNDHRPKIYDRYSKTLNVVLGKLKQMKAMSA